jgi:hypothetical protein
MKKIILNIVLVFVLLLTCKSIMYSQTYTVGVPVNQQFGWFIQTQTSSCYPGVTISCNFPYSTVTGVTNILIFDSVSVPNTMYYNPGHKIINVGDTIFITSASYNYDFYYPTAGKIKGMFFSTGIPQIANQHYPCGYLTYMDYLVNCNDPIDYVFHGTCTDSVLSGIENLNQNTKYQIYPNPARNNFTIQTSSNEKQFINVFDVNGKLVLTQTIIGITNIDATNFNVGVYNINISGNEGVINKHLVIVKE